MFCNHCGKELSNVNGKFCPFCGKEIGESHATDHMMEGTYNEAYSTISDHRRNERVSTMTTVALVMEICGIILFFVSAVYVADTGGHPFWGTMVFISPIAAIIGWIIGRTEYKRNRNEEYAKLANKIGMICFFIVVTIVIIAISINAGMAIEYYS